MTFFLQQLSMGQTETYTIKKAAFSSDEYDEFCPVYYKNRIVFCTNRPSSSFLNYTTPDGKGPVKIDYIDTTGKVTVSRAELFSKSLETHLNDGPVTFNSKCDTIYYARNLQVGGNLSKLSTTRNKLGIFSAIYDGKNWIKIREMRFNNEYYNISTPWLSPDGKKLYFASDKPDGYGGSDLYYSQWKGDYWSDPVNLGPVINTKGNEAYPYVDSAGELFFSSDGHKGYGGKDIYYSRMKDGKWLTPVLLDPPINSEYDDFGIITDSLINEGYFSSNRGKSIDIYEFKTNIPQIFYTDIQKENQYCFNFSDSGSIAVDTTILEFVWDFGDGQRSSGAVVHHCYQGPGKYNVKLDLYDRATGKLFFSKLSYSLDLKDFEQPYINSPMAVTSGENVDFDGLKSFLPGYSIISYSWDFGDGGRMSGKSARYIYKKAGEYNVNLGLKIKSFLTGAVMNTGVTKKVMAFDNLQQKASYIAKSDSLNKWFPDIRAYVNALINTKYSAEEESGKESLYRIHIMTSKTSIGTSNNTFNNIRWKYHIKEELLPDSNVYSYIADQYMSLMDAYPSFRELYRIGFKDLRISLEISGDPVEKELVRIIKNYGVLSETFFDANNRLTANGYLLLDQIVILMNRNPDIRIEVGVHTDNIGQAVNNLTMSQTRAQLMVNYLINRGIDKDRLVARGYGGVRPVASNFLEKDRRLNRRVDFTLIN